MALTPDEIEQRTAWADILDEAEERDIPQGQGALCTKRGLCCLGAAALFDLAASQGRNTVEDFAGFTRFDFKGFISLNDERHRTFSEIADVVRASIDRPDMGIIELDDLVNGDDDE